MNKELYILHHLGLGDHIICNGLLRNILPFNQRNFLFCKEQYIESIKFMYRDLNNIELIPVINENLLEVEKVLAQHKHIRITTDGYSDMYFEKIFYKSVNIDYEKRWSDFYLKRDYDRELSLYNRLQIKLVGLPNKDYVFVHDDSSRNYNIKKQYLDGKIVFRPSAKTTNNIFDYITIIENAKEIHCIESSFKCLVEHIDTKAKLYLHTYSRYQPFYNPTISKKDWIIV